MADGAVFGLLIIALFAMSLEFGYWKGLLFNPPWLESLQGNIFFTILALAIPVLIALGLHLLIRQKLAERIMAKLDIHAGYGSLAAAFRKSTRFWRSIFQPDPAGWNSRTRRRLDAVRNSTDRFVQYLNDKFTSPSGNKPKPDAASAT